MPPPPTSSSRPPRHNIHRGPASSAAAASASQKQHPRAPLRRIIWTGAIFAITVAGAFYGAGLKSQQELGEERKKRREMSVDERIGLLQDRRAELFRQRVPVERKLDEIRARIAATDAVEKGKERKEVKEAGTGTGTGR